MIYEIKIIVETSKEFLFSFDECNEILKVGLNKMNELSKDIPNRYKSIQVAIKTSEYII